MNDYPYIRAWHAMLQSTEFRIEDQLAQARRDKAPQNAIYFIENRWHTFSDIQNSNIRLMVENCLRRYMKDSHEPTA